MESRMEKYYKENPEYYKRSKRNEALYRDITRDMNDLDNLPIPDNSNEIDSRLFLVEMSIVKLKIWEELLLEKE